MMVVIIFLPYFFSCVFLCVRCFCFFLVKIRCCFFGLNVIPVVVAVAPRGTKKNKGGCGEEGARNATGQYSRRCRVLW